MTGPMNTEDPVSPCIMICQLDTASGHCLGCGRTIGEITRWVHLSNPERIAIKRQLPARLEALSKGAPAA
jgi:predicted Fe-S protein YdhL (DUF1289 family)